MAEVNVAEIDRDLLAVGCLGPQLMHCAHHPSPSNSIRLPSVGMSNGCSQGACKARATVTRASGNLCSLIYPGALRRSSSNDNTVDLASSGPVGTSATEVRCF